MATAKAIARVERLVWILIYAGLFSIVIGLAGLKVAPATAWALIAAGCVLAAVGVVLIWVRSRMHNGPSHPPQGKQR